MRSAAIESDANSYDDVEYVTSLTPDELDCISKWMALAFESDAFCSVWIPKIYRKDPAGFQAIFKWVIQRGLKCGKLLMNKDRTAMRLIFPPGMSNNAINPDWRSGDDDLFDAYMRQHGQRYGEMSSEVFNRIAAIVVPGYGQDLGAGEAYQSLLLGVHPEHHGKGLGTKLHRFTCTEMAREYPDAKWWFLVGNQNLSYYSKFGGKSIGTFTLPVNYDEIVGLDDKPYNEGSKLLHIFEVDSARNAAKYQTWRQLDGRRNL